MGLVRKIIHSCVTADTNLFIHSILIKAITNTENIT